MAEKQTIKKFDVGALDQVLAAPGPYDFTHIKLRSTDLRNYHGHVVAEVEEQPESPERTKILELLGNMNDELEELETWVRDEAGKSAIAVAKANLAKAEAEFKAASAATK